ncbi:2-amino-4-hydroxy-6-hydroxymethyldihydropteridine diphosphokinase [Candidatus Pacearchaeota archaeon]|nr:MAG: 2-amino-4-hydroxy-6-hydroxymethyldihydropteridine diphosphokinase [Candidatus Pacearchaeota archaeon]
MENLFFLKDFSYICLSLGANIGEKLHNFRRVVEFLKKRGSVKKISSIYLSEPWGEKKQPFFLNFSIFYETSLLPFELLSFVKKIENLIGRYKVGRWGRRKIDIDIIFYKNFHIKKGNLLTIPHRYWQDRPFVYKPLEELFDISFDHAYKKFKILKLGKIL